MGKRKLTRAEPPSSTAQKATSGDNTAVSHEQQQHSRKRPRTVQRLQGVAATAERLWKEALAPRIPLVIPAGLSDMQQSLSNKWTNEYLKSKAGTSKVTVEQRSGSKDSFGKGRKVNMTFGQLVQQLQDGNDSLYMTTQEVGINASGQPNITASPIRQLQSDFPLRPKCTGNLIPQQINLWMGAAPEGASSGLHHDFHDNLYILLRGRKRFRLYPPSEAHNMYTHGQIKLVYPNGRIVYQNQHMVCADGSDPKQVQRWQRQQAAETELAAAEDAVKAGIKGAKARLVKAEQALDSVLEADLEMPPADHDDEDCSSNSSFPTDLHDDYVDSDVADSSDDDHTMPSSKHPSNKRQKLRIHDRDHSSTNCTSSDQQPDRSKEEPPSFSQVDLSKPHREIQKQFPLFPGPERCQECELNAGEMLYLPCGWFHEVQSFGSGQEGGHLALNYWFHPPDNLDTSKKGMRQPYRSGYWQAVWTHSRSH